MSDKFISWEEAVVWLKGQENQHELVKSCFYDDPLSSAAERYYNSSEWQELREILPKSPGKALDLGAGRGITSYALAREGWETVALEPDRSNIVGAGAIRLLARESDLKIQVEENWGEELPFSDSCFDLVHGRQVLHHARDLNQFCREIARVLRKGGMFIATREHVISKQDDLNVFLKSHPLHYLYGGENAFLLREYIQAIESAGIHLIQVFNPYQSNINLFPETRISLKKKLADKIKLSWPNLIPDFLLNIIGAFNNTPGRLYTFVGHRK
jgi:SAM-dependent methyltransferase